MTQVCRIPCKSILIITYNKKATIELQERLQLLLGDISPSAYTIHGFCYKILRSNSSIKYEILSDEKHKNWILKKILLEMKLDKQYQPESLSSEISYIKNSGVMPADKFLRKIISNFDEFKSKNKLLDFDDLLINTLKLLKGSPSLVSFIQRQFQYILVDEAQDLNPVQYSLIKMLSYSGNSVCLVGDPRQSIYGFRAADVNLLKDLKINYPDIETIKLNINFRSTAPIVRIANEIIKHSNLEFPSDLLSTKLSEHVPKLIRPSDANEEASIIINAIKESITDPNISYLDFAILYRTNKVARNMYEQLILNDIPFSAPGLTSNFYEHEIVMPVISYLRLSITPDDEDAFKNASRTMYISKLRLQTLFKDSKSHPELSLVEALLTIPGLQDYQYDIIDDRIILLDLLKQLSPFNAIRKIRESFYDKYLKIDDLSMRSETIKETLEELESAAKHYSSIQEFITFINDFSVQIKSTQIESNDNDKVSLLSIHSAKGLQFTKVYVIGCVDGVIPHKHSLEPNLSNTNLYSYSCDIEEEVRLLYVAITRAMDGVYISSPKQFNSHPTEVSRFLKPLFYTQNYVKGGDRND